jgi:cystathionine beta-lyase
LEEWCRLLCFWQKEDAVDFLEKLKVFSRIIGRSRVVGKSSCADDTRFHSEDKRKEIGITDDLVRLSVGIEDAADLIEDLTQALAINTKPHTNNSFGAYFFILGY